MLVMQQGRVVRDATTSDLLTADTTLVRAERPAIPWNFIVWAVPGAILGADRTSVHAQPTGYRRYVMSVIRTRASHGAVAASDRGHRPRSVVRSPGG